MRDLKTTIVPNVVLSQAKVVDIATQFAGLGYDAVEMNWRTSCPFCGAEGTLLQCALFATGVVVPFLGDDEGYQPQVAEVLKNRWMECSACGADQVS